MWSRVSEFHMKKTPFIIKILTERYDRHWRFTTSFSGYSIVVLIHDRQSIHRSPGDSVILSRFQRSSEHNVTRSYCMMVKAFQRSTEYSKVVKDLRFKDRQRFRDRQRFKDRKRSFKYSYIFRRFENRFKSMHITG